MLTSAPGFVVGGKAETQVTGPFSAGLPSRTAICAPAGRTGGAGPHCTYLRARGRVGLRRNGTMPHGHGEGEGDDRNAEGAADIIGFSSVESP